VTLNDFSGEFQTAETFETSFASLKLITLATVRRCHR